MALRLRIIARRPCAILRGRAQASHFEKRKSSIPRVAVGHADRHPHHHHCRVLRERRSGRHFTGQLIDSTGQRPLRRHGSVLVQDESVKTFDFSGLGIRNGGYIAFEERRDDLERLGSIDDF